MKDDAMYKKHEMSEMKGEMKKEHEYSSKGMEKPHTPKAEGGLLKVTLEGSGRSCYPKPKKLNHEDY